ncbi:hypothetical protein BCR39DRAFT_524925 [Naematelia encephala]|uniref:Rho-GAP domain-containing protein n=1 Tax=Naematelia encephala TaxID=71784 RepID=A0A1Y2BAV8_9TREE|nr:hypothetical protein BCR39DRAFT_524925 [Naematelia encephala]
MSLPSSTELPSPPSSPSSSSTRTSLPLLSTLSRLSLSTSRPNVPSPEPSNYASKTLRFVSSSSKSMLQRSGLPGLFTTSNERDSPAAPREESPLAFARSRGSIDTSTVLYPTLQIHPSPAIHPILVLSLASVSDIASGVTNDEVFTTLLRKLEPWVGEEGDGGYVLIVLAAQGDKRARSMPRGPWWAWKWRKIPRKYRKNLKRLYIVHPSLLTRTLLPIILPFLSPKSYPKLHPLASLLQLPATYGVSLKGIDITLDVLKEESRVLRERLDKPERSNAPAYSEKPSQDTDGSWGYGTISSMLGTAGSYLSLPRFGSDGSLPATTEAFIRGKGYWKRTAEAIMADFNGKTPKLLIDLSQVILHECTTTEGIFRRSNNSTLLPAIEGILDLPVDQQPTLPWTELAQDDPLLPPIVLLRFLRDLAEPLVPPSAYPAIRASKDLDSAQDSFLSSLPSSSRHILLHVTSLLHELSSHEPATRMSSLALAIVLAPSLIRSTDALDDAELCLEPGKTLPSAMMKTSGREAGKGSGTLVGVLELLIREGSSEASQPGLARDTGSKGRHDLFEPGHMRGVSGDRRRSGTTTGQSEVFVG